MCVLFFCDQQVVNIEKNTMAAGLHISISAEKLLTIGGIDITNSMITSLIVSGLLIAFAVMVRLQLKDTSNPKGLQNFAEWIVESLHNLVHGITGDLKKTRLFLPFVGTFLLWILLNNWLGLFPGVGTIGIVHEETHAPAEEEQTSTHFIPSVQAATQEHVETVTLHTEKAEEEADVHTPTHSHAADLHANSDTAHVTDETHTETTTETTTHMETEKHVNTHAGEAGHKEAGHGAFVPILRPGTADLNTTLALAIVSVAATQVFGISALGLGYFKKFINFSDPIMFFVGILEFISECAKIVSFAFRLFGNIFAGEVLLVVIASLVPIVVPMPFYGLELFVGFIQALVFSLLSLVFFNMATQSHDNH